MTSLIPPICSRLPSLRAPLQDHLFKAFYAFRISRTGATPRNSCPTCVHQYRVSRIPLARELGMSNSPELLLRTSADLERVVEHLRPQLETVHQTTRMPKRVLACTRTPGISERYIFHKGRFSRLSEGFAGSRAHFSSTRDISSPSTADHAEATGSCTTSEIVDTNMSVNAVADYLVSMIKKQVCSESGTVTPQTELESLLMRDARYWDCLDTVEFLLDVEELFNIIIPDEAADGFRTVQEIADFVIAHRRAEVTGEGAKAEVRQGEN